MDIELAHARWRLSTLPIDQVDGIATWALAVGYDGPALRELAWHHDSWAEVNDLFGQAMQELGRAPLAFDEVVTTLVTRVAAQILSGAMTPSEGASLVYFDLFAQDLRAEVADPVRQFIDLADEYDAAVMAEDYAWEEVALAQLLEVSHTLVTTGLEPTLTSKTEQTGLEPSLE